ncbi:hypothetical protein [Sporichthya sp.]|uniref:hypothetical protein n=1 Tax=Sporichthya sp. TaxID=65475 RepID=UPI0025D08B38|nr:hypothetical protein [Sporichthya sp.]
MNRAPRRAVAAGMIAAFLVALVVGVLGIDVRATIGGRAAVDEPQYLLTALSLAEDGDLDISDELYDRRWRAFHDRNLPVQTQPKADGSAISPHDPLLPILIAAPMGLWGFEGAKATLCVIAGLAAALTVWVAVRRFGVRPALATAVVSVAFASPPLGIYAQQVYPEMPAALATLVAVAALTGSWTWRARIAFVLAVVALPWLSVKYAPAAVTLALVGLYRLWRSRGRLAVFTLLTVFAGMGVAYLVVHQLIWDGWTVYASGDFFQEPGEFAVVGTDPNYLGRSDRLAALLIDRNWGIAAWQPAYLLVIPAVAALLAARPRGWAGLILPAAAGWFVATFVALTMSGFWSPGRQLVVILPLLLVVIAWWLQTAPPGVLVSGAALGFVGVVAMGALLIDGWDRRITWVFGFDKVDDPLYDGWKVFLPPYQEGAGAEIWVRHGIWMVVIAAVAALACRAARPRGEAVGSGSVAEPSDVEVGSQAR